jgi:hypothetical protein
MTEWIPSQAKFAGGIIGTFLFGFSTFAMGSVEYKAADDCEPTVAWGEAPCRLGAVALAAANPIGEIAILKPFWDDKARKNLDNAGLTLSILGLGTSMVGGLVKNRPSTW